MESRNNISKGQGGKANKPSTGSVKTGSTASHRPAIVQHRLVNLVSRKFEEVVLEEVIDIEIEQPEQIMIKPTIKVDAKLLNGNQKRFVNEASESSEDKKMDRLVKSGQYKEDRGDFKLVDANKDLMAE